MSTMTPNTSESVSFSLAELAKLEAERVRHEEAQRARAREIEARQRREAEAARRAAEEAKLAADAEARARRVREEAAEKARAEARERAAIEVARIEAEAKARLEADNAARAHELSVLRARSEGRNRRLQQVLGAALGLVLCGGSVAAYSAARHVDGLKQEAAQLREAHVSLARERDHAKATELAALDRRFDRLRARPLARGAEDARATAEAARNAIDAKSLDHDRMRAFGDALDVLQTRIEGLEKIAALDRRHDDLTAWAAGLRRPDATAAARTASVRAKAMGTDEGAIRAYEGALDALRDTLAQNVKGVGGPRIKDPIPVVGTCLPSDPGCGLDGRPLF